MAFGKKTSIKSMRRDAESQSTTFIRYVKDGETQVRFMSEPDDGWVRYEEIFDTIEKKSYPYPESPDAQGYKLDLGDNGTQSRSVRYLAPVLIITEDGGTEEVEVAIIKLTKTMVADLLIQEKRNSTLTDRDYYLLREGKGFDTKYTASPDAPSERVLTKAQFAAVPNAEQLLMDQYNEFFDIDTDDEDDEDEVETTPEEKPPARKRRAPKPAPEPEPEEETELDGLNAAEEEDDGPVYEDDLTDTDPDDSDDAKEEDGDFITDEEILEMTVPQLKELAREVGIDVKGLRSAEKIAALIIKKLEEEGE